MEQTELLHLEDAGKFIYICRACRHKATRTGLMDCKRLVCSKCGTRNPWVTLPRMPASKRRKLLAEWDWEQVQSYPPVEWDSATAVEEQLQRQENTPSAVERG